MTPTPAAPAADYAHADELAALLDAPRRSLDALFVAVPEVSDAPTGLAPDAAIIMLRAIIDMLPGNVFAKDRQGRYLVANAQTEMALGADRVALLGFTDAEILGDGEEAARLVAVDRRVMASGQPETLEEAVTLADGSVLTWLSTKVPLRDAQNEIIGIIGFSTDITARKAAEAALAANEAQLAAVLDALPVGILIADAEGAIVRDNAASRELWGVASAGGDFSGYAGADRGLAAALRDGEMMRGELVARDRRRYLTSAAPVRDADGAIIGGVVAQIDVTGGLPAGIATSN
ncbi:PAS domain-containing protein [Sphingoaurantiacus capsulatus]|uniref:PAS domain-containing protein n=1 Tax=Sphingoaurantiacus capsulatus TaxID=1771310 RepID=A0ABV7X5Y4_9SPHN